MKEISVVLRIWAAVFLLLRSTYCEVCFPPEAEVTTFAVVAQKEYYFGANYTAGKAVAINTDPAEDEWRLWDYNTGRIYSKDTGRDCTYLSLNPDEMIKRCFPSNAKLTARLEGGREVYQFEAEKLHYEIGVVHFEGSKYYTDILTRMKDANNQEIDTYLHYENKMGLSRPGVFDMDLSQCTEAHWKTEL